MKINARVVLITLCATLVTGCASGWLGGAPASEAENIRIISVGNAKTCKLIGPLDATSAFPQDQDIYLAAMTRLRTKAAGMSGNAVLVHSYQVQSGATGSSATVKADAYVCPAAEGGE